ncbi:MAG TPA: heavy-metal-associated domain-containing protein [Chitinophagaceae bacterium]|nr:heavy-metal-associated domain-containing protein [Chitinophagaceae bacterium]
MKYQFKTNIMCNNCIAKVTPFLNGNAEIKHWEVDIQNPQKILTVETELSDDKIREMVKEAGYKAEEIKEQHSD